MKQAQVGQKPKALWRWLGLLSLGYVGVGVVVALWARDKGVPDGAYGFTVCALWWPATLVLVLFPD
jgi:hypothetical protein